MMRTFDELSVVNIEVTSRCNLSCRYCSRNKWGAGFGGSDMTLAEFKRIAAMFPRTATLAPYLAGEPTLNPELPAMIEAARGMDFERVRIHTNGTTLTRQLSWALVDAGLTTIVFSVDGADAAEYERLRGADFWRTFNNIALFAAAAHGKVELGVQCLIPSGEPLELNRDLSLLRPHFAVEIVEHPHSWTVADAIPGSERLAASEVPCFFLTRHMVVSAEGDYLLCCCCLNRERILGNARKMTPRQAWEGPMEEIRQAQLRGERMAPCSGCERYGAGAAP